LIMPGRRAKQGRNRNRAEIRALIEARPSLTMCEISRTLGLNKTGLSGGRMLYRFSIPFLTVPTQNTPHGRDGTVNAGNT